MPDRRPRSASVIVLGLAFASVLALAALDSIREGRQTVDRRSELAASPVLGRMSELAWAGREARALRAFRSRLEPDDRFALVFGEGVDESRLRLLSHFYFYPAVDVTALGAANVIVGFGAGARPPPGVDRREVVGSAWLARRAP
jgi:hypothetical protein